MKKLFLITAVLTFALGCGETANCGWTLEWQIIFDNIKYNNIKYQINVQYNNKTDTYDGSLLDSEYIYQFFYVDGSVEIVNSSTRPNVSLQLRGMDGTLLDTVFTWEEMNFKCQMSRQYGKEYCQLSKKIINLR
jgi:hypothetical protein